MSLCYERYNKRDAEKVVISGDYTKIGRNAFARHEELKEVVLPDSVETIEDYAFSGCTSLCIIKMPENLTSIGKYAFADCKNLEYLSLPKELKQIKRYAFTTCPLLKKVSLYDNIEYIDDYAFYMCSSLEAITLIGTNTQITFRHPSSDHAFRMFLRLILIFITADEKGKHEMIEKMYFSVYKIPFVIFYAMNYENSKSISYLKRNIHDAVKYLIDNNDSENLTNILKYIKKDNIDTFISYTIENKKYEQQIILVNYKNRKFGFDSPLDISFLE